MSPLLNLFSQGTIERLGWMLVHFLWQATAVALLLAVTLRTLRRASASLRYAVSCTALALIVLLPVVTIQLVEVSGPAAEAGPPPVMSPPPAAAMRPVTVEMVDEMSPFTDLVPLTAADLSMRISWRERLTAGLESALPYVVLGWLVGVLGLSAWHLGGWAQLQQLKRRMVREAGVPIQDALRKLAARLGVRQTVRLLESALVEVPTVVGWLRPVILLPASALTGLSTEQLEAILAHELAHVRRYDYLVNIVQTVVEILGFYHPAVWWVSRCIRVERENCCDDLAVRICGSSLQYARALTTLEEIRHSRAELAVAATGGSLVARVARLLGRPAIDDCRFAWLPGLVALVVVAGLIIPAAMVLATPANPPVSSPSRNASDARAEEGTTETVLDTEPNRVDLDVLVAEIFSDAILDPATAQQAGSLLSLTREYLQAQPLASVIQTYAADPNLPGETLSDLVNLLVAQGYAEILAQPTVLLTRDQQSVINIRNPADPNLFERMDKAKRFDLTLGVTPEAASDANGVVLDTYLHFNHPILLRHDGSAWVGVNSIRLHCPWPAGYDKYYISPLAEREDQQGRMRMALVLLRAQVARDNEADTNAPGGTPGRPAVQVATRALPQGGVQKQDESTVLIDIVVAKVLTGATLDRETALRVGELLAVEAPQEKATLGDVLRRHVVGKLLTPATAEALLDLLQSRGYMETQARPSILTRDNVQAQIKVGREELIEGGSDPNSPRRIELGTAVRATPHVPDPAGEHIRLELGVEFSERAPQTQPDAPPAVRTTEIASTVTALSDRYFSLLAERDSGEDTQAKDPEAVLVMVKPRIVKAARGSADGPAAEQTEPRPRQVLVEVRTVALKAGQLAALGIEWSANSTNALTGGMWSPDSTNAPASGIQMGYTPDRAFTDALLTTLRTLQEQDRAEILSSQQIVATDGSPSRIRAVTQEWPSQAGLPKIDSGTVLSITPRVDDRDQITLEIKVETSKALPRRQGNDLPIVTRQTAKSMVTLKDGGTAALAGLTETPPGQSPPSMKEIAILVTAHLLPEVSQAIEPQKARVLPERSVGARQSRITATFNNADLLSVLMQISRHFFPNAQVAVDSTVKQQPVTVELVEAPPEAAIRQALNGTGYVCEHMVEPGSSWYKVYRPITGRFEGIDLRGALQQISAAADVPIIIDPNVDEDEDVWASFESIDLWRALEIVLAGTPYTLRKTADGAYLVFRPLSNSFLGLDLATTLQDLSDAARVPIVTAPNVSGTVTATFENLTLEEALELVLAGKPYGFKRMSHYYLVTDHTAESVGIAEDSKVRVIHLQHVTAQRAMSLLHPAFAPFVKIPSPDDLAPADRDRILVLTAPPATAERIAAEMQRIDVRIRNVLLDCRVALMERRDLMKLGVAWSKKAGLAGSNPAIGIQVGSVPDRLSTEALLAALNDLRDRSRADITAGPQVLAQDGRQSTFGCVGLDHHYGEDMKTSVRRHAELYGTLWEAALGITPRIEDSDGIALEMLVRATYDAALDRYDNGGSEVTREYRRKITVADGGTVVLTGFTGDEDRLNRKSTREVVVFVTPRLIPEPRATTSGSSQPAGTVTARRPVNGNQTVDTTDANESSATASATLTGTPYGVFQ